jgi:superfamily II DNA or RNA helicase
MEQAIEIQDLIRDIGIYNSLPKQHKKIVFNTWRQYVDYEGLIIMFDKFNQEKLNELFRCIQKLLDQHVSHNLILQSLDRYNSIVKFILDNYDEEIKENENAIENHDNHDNHDNHTPLKVIKCEKEKKLFIWRDNQIKGWQSAVNSGFINGIHSQATGSGKSLIALKTINEYNKQNPKDHILWICERKDIPRKMFFRGVNKKHIGLHHTSNFEFWKDNDIINMSKFHIVEHIYNKDQKWTDKLNEYDGVKPIFLIINRAFMTTKSKVQGKGYRYEEIRKMPKFAIIDECHSSMASETYQLLSYLKFNRDTKIHGMSATPYKNGKSNTRITIDINCDDDIDIETRKNEEKLLNIFCKPGNVNQLNLLSFFNLKDAIEAGVILEPRFYWYTIEPPDAKTNTKIYNKNDIHSVLCVLDTIIGKCKYKKCIVWCGTIELAENWYNIFEEHKHNKYNNLPNIESFIDHSKRKKSDSDYDKFYDLTDKSILFCANKFREGSDIPYLSCCLFLDKVVNRGTIPFIQCIGRVLRKDDENHKKNGHILDGCIKESDNHKLKSIVNKILGYYVHLYEISKSDFIFDDNIEMSKSKIDLYNQIAQSINFSPEKKKIIIKLKNDKTMEIDVTRLELSTLEWKKIIPNFNAVLKQMIVMSDYDEYIGMQEYCIKIGIKDRNDYVKKYKKYSNLVKIDDNGDTTMLDPKERFPMYFKNWYDFLKIDTNGFIKSIVKWRKLCNSKKIKNIKEYFKLCSRDKTFPIMPEEFYHGYTNFSNEINPKNNVIFL